MGKSKEKWLKIGITILSRQGGGALTIDQMARDLRLTKGSFYHHFANMADFEVQLIAYWADQYLLTASAIPDDPAGGLALLDTVMAQAFGPAAESEVAIRALAQQNDKLRPHVERVDVSRHDFVFQIFLSLTADVIRARRMADILFTMLIGSIMALPRYSPERVSTLYAEFKQLYKLESI